MAHKWDPKCRQPSGLVRPVRVVAKGQDGLSRAQARSDRCRKTSHGYFVPSGTPTDVPEQRILEQSVRLSPGGAVTGWAACRWWGANFFDGLESDGTTPIQVPLAVGPRGKLRSGPDVSVSYEQLPPDEVVAGPWFRLTVRERATFDEMRRTGDLRDAVVAMDMMAAAEATSIRRMRRYADSHGRWRRGSLVVAALELASEHSRSPNETRLRLIWVLDAGLPDTVLANCPIHDLDGRLLGIADLLDPVAGLVVEYDGADHRGALRHSKDVGKEDRLRNVGLEVARVTGPDLRRTALVVSRLHTARARARFEAPAERRWVARPPRDTVDDVIEERENLERLLESSDED